jgi:hypothetical protein
MRNPPKHPSCDPELILKADAQAEREGAGWNACRECDMQGLWWSESRREPSGWAARLCEDCAGYGWTYYVEGARPARQSVPRMAERFDRRVGW